jgi:hypothetical protein
MEAEVAALIEKERLKARLADAGMGKLSVEGVATVARLIDDVFVKRNRHGIISGQVSGPTRDSRRRRVKKAAGKPQPETAEWKEARLEARLADAGMGKLSVEGVATVVRLIDDVFVMRNRHGKIISGEVSGRTRRSRRRRVKKAAAMKPPPKAQATPAPRRSKRMRLST